MDVINGELSLTGPIFDCNDDDAPCRSSVINCPIDDDCVVNCGLPTINDVSLCSDLTVVCAPDRDCTVNCGVIFDLSRRVCDNLKVIGGDGGRLTVNALWGDAIEGADIQCPDGGECIINCNAMFGDDESCEAVTINGSPVKGSDLIITVDGDEAFEENGNINCPLMSDCYVICRGDESCEYLTITSPRDGDLIIECDNFDSGARPCQHMIIDASNMIKGTLNITGNLENIQEIHCPRSRLAQCVIIGNFQDPDDKTKLIAPIGWANVYLECDDPTYCDLPSEERDALEIFCFGPTKYFGRFTEPDCCILELDTDDLTGTSWICVDWDGTTATELPCNRCNQCPDDGAPAECPDDFCFGKPSGKGPKGR